MVVVVEREERLSRSTNRVQAIYVNAVARDSLGGDTLVAVGAYFPSSAFSTSESLVWQVREQPQLQPAAMCLDMRNRRPIIHASISQRESWKLWQTDSIGFTVLNQLQPMSNILGALRYYPRRYSTASLSLLEIRSPNLVLSPISVLRSDP